MSPGSAPPFVALPPWRYQTASSYTDAMLGSRASGGDLSSLAPARHQPGVLGTVSLALGELQALLGPDLVSTDVWVREHTLLGYEWLDLGPAARQALHTWVVTGTGRLLHANQAYWMAQRALPERVCLVCEQEAWGGPGMRGTLCPHQADFVTVCWKHGVHTTRRMPGVRPRGARRLGDGSPLERAYTSAAFCIWQAGIDPPALAARLRADLGAAGYLHPNGDFRVTQLERELARFVAPMRNARLRKLVTAPLACRQLTQWVDGRRPGIHPVRLVVLEAHLRQVSGDSA